MSVVKEDKKFNLVIVICFSGEIEFMYEFEPDDAQRLYDNPLEEGIKKWIPNESYADLEETQGAIDFYVNCVNSKHLLLIFFEKILIIIPTLDILCIN